PLEFVPAVRQRVELGAEPPCLTGRENVLQVRPVPDAEHGKVPRVQVVKAGHVALTHGSLLGALVAGHPGYVGEVRSAPTRSAPWRPRPNCSARTRLRRWTPHPGRPALGAGRGPAPPPARRTTRNRSTATARWTGHTGWD